MATEKQMAANRENAKKGGVKTEEGKAIVKWNALRHGLLAKEAVIDAGDGRESREEFDQFLAELRESLQPQGTLEEVLLEMVGVAYWRLRRILRWEVGQLRKQLDFYRRDFYQEKAEERTDALDSGEDPPRIPKGWDEIRLSQIAKESSLKPEQSENLIRYESALIRQFYRAMHELERLQRARQGIATPSPVTVEVDLTSSNP